MNSNSSLNWRSKIFRILQRIAPKGSSLDAVFDSYDDWRQARQNDSADQAAKDAPKQPKKE
jgi:hypothetical protein